MIKSFHAAAVQQNGHIRSSHIGTTMPPPPPPPLLLLLLFRASHLLCLAVVTQCASRTTTQTLLVRCVYHTAT
jgi:hypothetical protein